jgi:protein ImuA
MSGTREKLAGARELLDPILGEGRSLTRCALGHGDADAILRGGLVRGTLHEIFARDAAASGFAACTAQLVSGAKHILWIVQDFAALEHGELSPSGFAELGIAPAKLLLLRAANAEDALRAGVDALSCTGLDAVVMEIAGNPKILDLVASRRLTLAAQHKNVTAFLLRQGAAVEPSAAQTRWLIRSHPSAATDDWGMPRFDAALVRNRQGETGHWVMEWSCDDGVFRKPCDQAAHPGAVVRAPADGSAAAAEVRLAG